MGVADVAERVVGLDILLEGLATVEEVKVSKMFRVKRIAWRSVFERPATTRW